MSGSAGPSIPVIDAHVHIFSPEVCRERNRWCARVPWFGALYQNPNARLADVDDLIAAMDAAGVAQAIVCGFPWADPGLCREHNAYMATAVARFPERLSWLGIVNPASSDAVHDAIDCFRTGAVGLGEFNADAQAFDWRDTTVLAPIAEVAIAAAHPMLIHCSEPVGHAYPGKGTATPDRLLAFFAAFPDLDVVAAHWGGGLPFFELMPEVAVATKRVVYDCAASTYLYRRQVFQSVVQIVGADRVLFGSDYPVLRMDRFVKQVRELPWADQHQAAQVLGGNARRVFGLMETERT